jgi:hypothetical protein
MFEVIEGMEARMDEERSDVDGAPAISAHTGSADFVGAHSMTAAR